MTVYQTYDDIVNLTIDSTKPVATQVDTVTGFPTFASNRTYNFSVTETRPGWLTGRRPHLGQLFPRGIYNK